MQLDDLLSRCRAMRPDYTFSLLYFAKRPCAVVYKPVTKPDHEGLCFGIYENPRDEWHLRPRYKYDAAGLPLFDAKHQLVYDEPHSDDYYLDYELTHLLGAEWFEDGLPASVQTSQ